MEDDATKRKGFWDRVDLHFGAIDMTNINIKKRKREMSRIRRRRGTKMKRVSGWSEFTLRCHRHN